MILRPKPYRLFWLDAMGALLSAVLLGIVLPQYQIWIGLPVDMLHLLAHGACCLAAYSLRCAIQKPTEWAAHLRIIAIVNTVYCVVSASIIWWWWHQLTVWGSIYFVLEIAVVGGLALLEWHTAKRGH